MSNWQWARRDLLKTLSVTTVGGLSATTARGAADSDLSLSLDTQKSTLAPGETVDVTVTATNQSETDAPIKIEYHFLAPCPCTELLVDPTLPELKVAGEARRSYTRESVSAGESVTFSTTLRAPDELNPGKYKVYFPSQLGRCPGEDKSCQEEDLPSRSSVSTTIEVQQSEQLDLSVEAGTAPPGGTYTLTYRIENTGSTTIDGKNTIGIGVGPAAGQYPPGSAAKAEEDAVLADGAVDGVVWFDWTIAPGETLTAELPVVLSEDINPGDYEFTITATGAQSQEFDRASGTVTVLGQNRFDPAVHGFGFPNWAGTEGCLSKTTRIDQPCNSQTFSLPFDNPLTLDTARTYVGQSYSSLPQTVLEILARLLYQQVARQTVTDGHCYGMVFAAQQYFQTPEDLPAEVDTASEVSRPTGTFDSIGSTIRAYHTSQRISQDVVQFLVATKLGLVDLQQSQQALTRALDQQPTVPVALDRSTGGGHQLLAYDYFRQNENILIDVYDPNYAADAAPYDGDSFVSRMVVNSQTAELSGAYQGYDTYAPIDSSVTNSLVDGILTVQSRAELFAPLETAVSFSLNSPATLTVDAPDTASVVRGAGELVDRSRVADAATVVGASPEEVGVTVAGEGTGEYTLDAYGVEEETAVVEDEVTGTITPEETVEYRLDPDSDDQGGLTRGGSNGGELPPNIQRFDTNGEPGIQGDEVLDAISEFNEGGDVEATDVLDVISAFNENNG